jgi:hypothetical protein
VEPLALDDLWTELNMMASLIQNTGPILTPHRMLEAAPRLGMRGGGTTGRALRGFVPGDLTWTRDVRLVYWNRHRTSPYNGEPGTYVQAVDTRFGIGEFPDLDQPPVPLAADRT